MVLVMDGVLVVTAGWLLASTAAWRHDGSNHPRQGRKHARLQLGVLWLVSLWWYNRCPLVGSTGLRIRVDMFIGSFLPILDRMMKDDSHRPATEPRAVEVARVPIDGTEMTFLKSVRMYGIELAYHTTTLLATIFHSDPGLPERFDLPPKIEYAGQTVDGTD